MTFLILADFEPGDSYNTTLFHISRSIYNFWLDWSGMRNRSKMGERVKGMGKRYFRLIEGEGRRGKEILNRMKIAQITIKSVIFTGTIH